MSNKINVKTTIVLFIVSPRFRFVIKYYDLPLSRVKTNRLPVWWPALIIACTFILDKTFRARAGCERCRRAWCELWREAVRLSFDNCGYRIVTGVPLGEFTSDSRKMIIGTKSMETETQEQAPSCKLGRSRKNNEPTKRPCLSLGTAVLWWVYPY